VAEGRDGYAVLVPVRYVLYTHRDWDHATGGVWADRRVRGHRNMLTALARRRASCPARGREIDAKNSL
jgi:glyoxylase-like metal-dependent hydrolase (beta-lactamase superfamily II)